MPVTNTRTWMSPIAAVLLAACATGHDGDVNVGGGQSPDPVVLDIPIAYIRGPLPEDLTDLDDLDVRELETFEAGADVWLRDRAAPDVPEHNITERVTNGEWDVRDIDASYDGNKLIFSMRMPLIPGADDDEQPKWAIWEYDRTTDDLRRVIQSDIVADEGHDVAPHYLPDGRIVFSSTRQRTSKAVLIDEGKPQFSAQDEDQNEHAFVLHVMNADGSGIRQISFNQSHDLDPDVLDDGRIVFSRWENASGSSIHLYTVNPDGSDLQLLYGANSHATGTGGAVPGPAGPGTTEVQFLQPRPMEDGRVLALLKPFQGSDQGGDPVAIDTAAFVENDQADLDNPALQGPAQVRLSVNDVRTDPGLSPGGRYASVFPLRDGTGRLLTTWTLCRLNDTRRPHPALHAREPGGRDPDARASFIWCVALRSARRNPAAGAPADRGHPLHRSRVARPAHAAARRDHRRRAGRRLRPDPRDRERRHHRHPQRLRPRRRRRRAGRLSPR